MGVLRHRFCGVIETVPPQVVPSVLKVGVSLFRGEATIVTFVTPLGPEDEGDFHCFVGIQREFLR